MSGKNVIFILIFLYISLFSCRNLFKEDEEVVKDPRNFKWTIDTLYYPDYPLTLLYNIWGSSRKDVYVTGFGSSSLASIYQYNGSSWSTTKYHVSAGGNIEGATRIIDVYGFLYDDVWFSGYRSKDPIYYNLTIHYNGQSFKEIGSEKSGRLKSIWGSSSTDMWTCGKDKVYHLVGTEWQEVNVPISTMGIKFFKIMGFSSDDIYLSGRRLKEIAMEPHVFYLYHYDGQSWTVIDSTEFTNIGWRIPDLGMDLATIDGELYGAYQGAFKWSGSEWIQIHGDTTIYRIDGSSADNIFICGDWAALYHFNGKDWQKLNPIPGFRQPLTGAWTDGKEVFLVGNSYFKSYMLHGK